MGGLALGVSGLASATTSATPGVVAAAPSAGPDRPDKGEMRRAHPGAKRGGLVAAVTDSSLTVRTPGGTKTVGLNSSTSYYEGKTKATKAAVKVGKIVAVRLADPKASSPVASVVTVLPAHLGGFVTKIDGDTITIVDHSGFTRTIRTSSATTYEKNGAAGKASDVTVGALIRAVGTVAANGTTLEATTVRVGGPAKERGARFKGNRSG